MPECKSCGAFVTTRFIRVFGNNQDDVYGCHDCLSNTELASGQTVREHS
ncbi:DUF7563 family protein [Halovenus marina]